MKTYIAKEGYKSIIITFILFCAFWIFYHFSFLLFLLFLFCVFLFRKPKFSPLHLDEKAIINPVAGKVVKIENVLHKDLGECIELEIKNAFYNVGSINAPCQMHITQIQLTHGLFLCRALKSLNEKLLITALTNGYKIALCIYAGSMQRTIHFNAHSEFKIGDAMGFSLNSSVSLFLPHNTRILVGVGDELSSNSLLGYLA